MRVMFDTNVVLDLLLDREPFVKEAKILISKVEHGEFTGVLCASTLTTIHYLLLKSNGKEDAVTIIQSLLKLFEIASVNKSSLAKMLWKLTIKIMKMLSFINLPIIQDQI